MQDFRGHITPRATPIWRRTLTRRQLSRDKMSPNTRLLARQRRCSRRTGPCIKLSGPAQLKVRPQNMTKTWTPIEDGKDRRVSTIVHDYGRIREFPGQDVTVFEQMREWIGWVRLPPVWRHFARRYAGWDFRGVRAIPVREAKPHALASHVSLCRCSLLSNGRFPKSLPNPERKIRRNQALEWLR